MPGNSSGVSRATPGNNGGVSRQCLAISVLKAGRRVLIALSYYFGNPNIPLRYPKNSKTYSRYTTTLPHRNETSKSKNEAGFNLVCFKSSSMSIPPHSPSVTLPLPISSLLWSHLFHYAGYFTSSEQVCVEYRSLGDWELTAPCMGAEVKVQTKVQSKFIIGEFDLVYHIPGDKEYMHNGEFKKDVPLLEEVVVLEGAVHFVNQERPDEINQHIYDFIQKF
ncbi:hypothetical protein BC332_14165 [Capsicum chinense]|nr:hypothetical protein BC332_14165 [Capsicum chinense]